MDSPFQEVPGTPLLDRGRSYPDSQSPAAEVPVGLTDPPYSLSRLVNTPRGLVSPFVVPGGMSPITPRHGIDVSPRRSALARTTGRQIMRGHGTPQSMVQGRTPRRRPLDGTCQTTPDLTPMRRTVHRTPRQLLTPTGKGPKLAEQVVPSTPKQQQTENVFTTPKSRPEKVTIEITPTTSLITGKIPNKEIGQDDVMIDATGDHQSTSVRKDTTISKRAVVARQRRILIPKEKTRTVESSDILDNIK